MSVFKLSINIYIMKKRTIVVMLGIFVAVVPLSGIPTSWKNWIVIVSGLLIAAIAGIRRKKIN